MDYNAMEQDRRRRNTLFSRSHSMDFEKISSSERRQSRKGNNDSTKKRQHSKQSTSKSSNPSPEIPRLMACFDTPDTQHQTSSFGSRNPEHWESFHRRFSDSERNLRKTRRCGSGRGRYQRKRGCLWFSLVQVVSWRSDSTRAARDDVGTLYE
ncbi:hypothetical protein IV203_008204 [Nitzschia inconspicua]|uniref:Uncharacterized protein n=1 Tax=Nitzschia inconspicua TaxID=303405 RepID=A0A9K3KZT8_9STRA|nr:hypothetical protein IV203_011071 [Nitzschia inconspicua]KAG7352156.1 hypothetical protein IV203_008204 [Nitzschia inconspicua]